MAGRRRGARGGDGAQPPTPRTTAESREYAREICLRRLALRPHTRAELAAALRRNGIDDAVAAEVLDRYGEVGMIDDAAFARAWVTSRHHGRGLAGRALAGELRRKGVADEAVGDALGELDADTEEATARALVDRRMGSMRGLAPDVTLRRLVGMLARKGYSPGVAIRVVKQAMVERDEQEGFADDIDVDTLVDAVGDAEEHRDFG